MDYVESVLTVDGVPKLLSGTEEVITVQILDLKHIKGHMYSLKVSDGTKWVYGQLFGLELIDLAEANRLRSLSTVHIKKYFIDIHENIFCIHIQDADMYNSEDGRILGNPVQVKPTNHVRAQLK